jgi:hypothetical protein
MINLLQELEIRFKRDKIIGQQDYLVLQLNSDGSGILLTRGAIRGRLNECKMFEYESLKQFYIKCSEMLGKEIKFK